LSPKGPKKEFYLTDVIELMREKDLKITACPAKNSSEVLGINSRAQLAEAAALMRNRILAKLMDEGVSIIDPGSTYIDAEVAIGKDSTVFPGTFISGKTVIGENCTIGPNCDIKDSTIGSGVEGKMGSCVYSSSILDKCVLGPYAHIRPNCVIGPEAKVGNFTEIKASKIGKGSKVPHLSYIGDTEIGEKVNVGAGTITCNYDGVKKHRTIIRDGAFIGSNVNLVAPVTVGAGAKIGAGSTITDDIPDGALAIARARQVVKERK